MKIALLTNGLFPYVIGGMQKHSTNMAIYLSKVGVKVDLYYIQDDNYPAPDELHEELFDRVTGIHLFPVKHFKFPYFPGHHYPECLWKSYWIYRALRANLKGVEFVYSQGYMGWASIIAKKTNRPDLPPIGVNLHGLEALQEKRSLFSEALHCFSSQLVGWNLRNADFAMSLGGRLDALVADAGVGRNQILHSFNGIGRAWVPGRGRGDRRRPIRCIFVGRASERKGLKELNEVMRRLAGDGRFEFALVGPIPEGDQVDSPNVTYMGEVRDEVELRRIYQEGELLLCPSYSEGMPTVILEAIACGLFVVATDVGAVRLAVVPGTGCLIPSRSSEALFDALQDYLMGRVCFEKEIAEELIDRFRWESVASHLCHTLEAALSQPLTP